MASQPTLSPCQEIRLYETLISEGGILGGGRLSSHDSTKEKELKERIGE